MSEDIGGDVRTTVHTMKPGDAYTDAKGNLWLVEHLCLEPTVKMVRVWPLASDDQLASEPLRLTTRRGGVSGLMWEGFRRMGSPADRVSGQT